jgi:hypothetical protein
MTEATLPMKSRHLFQALGIVLLGAVAGCTTSQRNPSAVTIPLTSPSLLVYTPLSTNAFGNAGGNPWTIISNAFGASGSQPTALYYGPVTTNGITVFVRPEDQIVPTNGTVQFFVGAEPVNPLHRLLYQWQKNGTNIASATAAALTIPNCEVSDVGFYSCLVTLSNAIGSILVGGEDDSAPGARLFVYMGTNTMIAGPYMPGTGTRQCGSGGTLSYLGTMTVMNPHTGTKLFMKPEGKTECVLTDMTLSYYPSLGTVGYSAKVHFTETGFGGSGCSSGTLTISPALRYPPSAYVFSLYTTSGNLPMGMPLIVDVSWR